MSNNRNINHIVRNGYQPVSLHEGYQPRQAVDSDGNPLPIPTRFPSFSFTDLANGLIDSLPSQTASQVDQK